MGATGGSLAQLYRSGALEEELATLAMESFGEPVLLDRANTDFRLRVGSTSVPVPPLNRPTEEYARALSRLPLLDDQGDGMRSFIGLALLVMSTAPDVVLVDEPEAFLHPGQARALGRWLGGAAVRRGIQVILSTHDRDFVLGLLEADAPINLIRILRDGSVNHFAQLPPEDVAAVWADPVLRYSNVLQGLFHRRVVICEADADCRFYSAALAELASHSGRRSIADDVLFVPSGSKNRVHALATALRSLGVEARAIVDFDVFRESAELKRIVAALGGDWTEDMAAEYVAFAEPVQQASLWPLVKAAGLAAVPAGPPHVAVSGLLEKLRRIGLHVVPVGEMEGFDRAQSAHGASWVSQAIETGIHTSTEVVEFVDPLLNAL
jgi:hypothetical protein